MFDWWCRKKMMAQDSVNHDKEVNTERGRSGTRVTCLSTRQRIDIFFKFLHTVYTEFL